MRRILLLFIAILVASGCTKSINQNAVIDHSEAGDLALSQGKLPQAKEMYSRALSDIRLVKMGPQAESQLHLKLARTLGPVEVSFSSLLEPHFPSRPSGVREV